MSWLDDARRRRLDELGVFDFCFYRVGNFDDRDARRSMEAFYGKGGALEEVSAHAKARKLQGAFRYEQKGKDNLSYDEKARRGLAKTYVDRMEEKIALYRSTGNLEFMVDVFNYVLLEWRSPYHPAAHFRSTERDETHGG